MLNPEFWRQQNRFFREVTGIEEPPSFTRSLAILYERHANKLFITDIIMSFASFGSASLGHIEVARTISVLAMGPILSTLTSAACHYVHRFDEI